MPSGYMSGPPAGGLARHCWSRFTSSPVLPLLRSFKSASPESSGLPIIPSFLTYPASSRSSSAFCWLGDPVDFGCSNAKVLGRNGEWMIRASLLNTLVMSFSLSIAKERASRTVLSSNSFWSDGGSKLKNRAKYRGKGKGYREKEGFPIRWILSICARENA